MDVCFGWLSSPDGKQPVHEIGGSFTPVLVREDGSAFFLWDSVSDDRYVMDDMGTAVRTDWRIYGIDVEQGVTMLGLSFYFPDDQ